jgi:hypothetical protein
MRMARLPCHVRPIPKGQFDADLKSKSGHGGLLLMKQWSAIGIHTATWLAIGLLVSGCRTWVEPTLYTVTRAKSPITYDSRHITVNKPLSAFDSERLQSLRNGQGWTEAMPSADAREPQFRERSQSKERFDDLGDLAAKDHLVMLCFSGGGSRAARMAMHVMAGLEHAYQQKAGPDDLPLLDRIDSYSSVSGGSIYASLIASSFHAQNSRRMDDNRHRAFQSLKEDRRARWISGNLAVSAGLYYANPGHLGIVPLLLLTTEWDTLNLFARTQAYLQENQNLLVSRSQLMSLGDLEPTPRFFFNATCVESRMPFVFTQSTIHLESDLNPLSGVAYNPASDWLNLDLNRNYQAIQPNPLIHATTLEDIGSSANEFPLSYAVMASAAFPFIFNPLYLRNHAGEESEEEYVRLVDGGIYDNSGAITALELFSHLEAHHPNPKRRLTLITINADNQASAFDEKSLARLGRFNIDIPLRGTFEGIGSLNSFYYHQTQLLQATIRTRVASINQKAEEQKVDYFEVNLMDVTDPELKEGYQSISTGLTLTQRQDRILEQSVQHLLEQATGPQSLPRSEVIVQSLIR